MNMDTPGATGLHQPAINAADAETFLRGKALDGPFIDEASRLVAQASSPSGDVRGPAEDKRKMAAILFRRATGAVRQRRSSHDGMHLGSR